MNTQPEILNLPNQTADTEAAADGLLHFEHRGNGKIARLPKAIRDQVNQMILNGVTYPEIIERLGEHGKDLKPDNLSQWKKRGYRDWLIQQEWLDQITSKSSFSTDILTAPDTNGLHEAGLRFAAAQMFDQLMRFNAAFNALDSPDTSDKFARLVNALSRLNRAALAFKRYGDVCSKEKALELQQLDPDREWNENECEIWARRLDRLFLSPRRKPIAETPTSPQPPPNP